jgi:3-oxoacyl-(acyl-carrier-protein) synthase
MVAIVDLPDPIPYNHMQRHEAAIAMRQLLSPRDESSCLLVDSATGIARFDKSEHLAWHDWRGARWSTKHVIGETMGASAGFQVVAAVEALRTGLFKQAVVSSLGSNQQAVGVLLEGGHHSD